MEDHLPVAKNMTSHGLQTRVVIEFKQMYLDDDLFEYYYYKVECVAGDSFVTTSLTPHKVNWGQAEITVELSSNTVYKCKVVPTRAILKRDFQNRRVGGGTPSKEITVKTS